MMRPKSESCTLLFYTYIFLHFKHGVCYLNYCRILHSKILINQARRFSPPPHYLLQKLFLHAHPSTCCKKIGKRPLSSVIDRCLFWFIGLVSLLPLCVRNISELERCVKVGRWWKQVCHNQKEWHIRHACQDD